MDANIKDDVIKNDNEVNDQTIEKTETNIEEIKKDADTNLVDNKISKPDSQPAPQVVKETKQETANQPQKDKKGFSIAALVLGVVAIVLSCVWYISITCAILAIVFGTIGLKSSKKGMSIAGIITGVIGMILSIVLVIAIVMLGVSIFNSAKDAIEDSDYPSSYYYYND